jgi:nucleotide-binding universal stress UspA family protein
MRTLTLGRSGDGSTPGTATPSATAAEEVPSPPADNALVTEEASLSFGERELEGRDKVHLGVVLRGDPRTSLTAFCVSEGIELLVISTRMAGKLKKTLTGGSVSGYLIDKAPCPCLVAPMRAFGVGTEDEEGPLSPMTSATDGEWTAAAGGISPPGVASPTTGGTVAELQAALAERDRTIEALRRELEELQAAAH